jgi:hypothetical protein
MTASDDRGRFVLVGAEPGVFNVLFHGAPGRPGATARAVEGVRVRAGADTTADLAVIDGRPLRGVVIDRDTGEPVPGVPVLCYGPARPRSGVAVEALRTDEQGRFTFHVPPGEQYVVFQEGDIGGPLARQTIVVPEQGQIELVRLKKRPERNRGMMGMMKVAIARDAVEKAAGPEPPAPTKVAEAVVAEAKAAVPTLEPALAKGVRTAEVSKKAIGPAMAKGQRERAKAPADAPMVRTVTGHVRDPQGRPLAGVRLFVAGAPPRTRPGSSR